MLTNLVFISDCKGMKIKGKVKAVAADCRLIRHRRR
jgi:hypothetical protein